MELRLLERRPPSPGAKPTRCQTRLFKLLPVLAFLFLTVNAGNSIYRSRDDPSALVFIAFAYSDLVALFLCLNKFEKLGQDAPAEQRERLKTAVWVLATALNLAFSWRVAEVMPPALAFVVWAMAGSVAVGGFYGLFIYRNAEEKAAGDVCATVVEKELSPEEKL